MLSREENDLVTRVGPGTPLGDVMRRYWVPVCTSEQLPAPGLRSAAGSGCSAIISSPFATPTAASACSTNCACIAARRWRSGRVEDCGIRCLYHGWKFAVDGTVLDTPNHADPRMKAKLKAPAYPVNEIGGLVWAYIGPADRATGLSAPPLHGCARGKPLRRSRRRQGELSAALRRRRRQFARRHSSQRRGASRLDRQHSSVRNADTLNPGSLTSDDNAPRLDIDDTPVRLSLRRVAQDRKDRRRQGRRERSDRSVHHAVDADHPVAHELLHRAGNSAGR